jgi:hypothetical protein
LMYAPVILILAWQAAKNAKAAKKKLAKMTLAERAEAATEAEKAASEEAAKETVPCSCRMYPYES